MPYGMVVVLRWALALAGAMAVWKALMFFKWWNYCNDDASWSMCSEAAWMMTWGV